MFFLYDFSLEKLYNLLNLNLDKRGEEGKRRDAELIYYYLRQKFSHIEITDVVRCLYDIMNSSEKEIHALLSSFCNKQ